MSQVLLRFSSSQVLLQCFLWYSLSFWLSKVAAPTSDSWLDAVGALIVSWPRETKLQSKHIPKGRKVIRSCFLSIYKISSLAAGWPKCSDSLGLLPGAFASKHLQTGKKGKDGKALMVLPITHPNKGVKHCIVQERKDRQRVLEETRHAVFCDTCCTDVCCKQYQMCKWMQMPIATCWNSCPAARLGNWSARSTWFRHRTMQMQHCNRSCGTTVISIDPSNSKGMELVHILDSFRQLSRIAVSPRLWHVKGIARSAA